MTAPSDLQAWQFLATECGERLVAAAADVELRDIAALERLRKKWSQSQITAALSLVEGRRRGRTKFLSTDAMMLDVQGVEQATSDLVARHKAKRFEADATAATVGIVDFCCGIGGDAMALAKVAATTAIDCSDVRCWMASHNAHCATLCADVTTLPLDGRAVHFDPARRDERTNRRLYRLEDLQPGLAFLETIVATAVPAAVKLSPAAPLDQIPGCDIGEIEIIGQRGGLAQAVLWLGECAHGRGLRTATRLPDGRSLHGTPAPLPQAGHQGVGSIIAVLDPAVERAGLGHLPATATCLGELSSGLGVLTGEDDDGATGNPWLTTFHVLGEMAWRPPRVAKWLGDRSMRVETIKTRGKACDPDTAIRSMPRTGDDAVTLFVLRLGSRVRAIITQPDVLNGTKGA